MIIKILFYNLNMIINVNKQQLLLWSLPLSVMSAHETSREPLERLWWNFILNVLRLHIWLKSDKNNGQFTWKHECTYNKYLLEKKLFRKEVVDKIDPHILHIAYCHVYGVPWRIITSSGSDDWIYWRLLFIVSLIYNQYSATADLLTS
jgi:hypothetical protein